MDFLKHEKLVKQQSVPVGKVEAVFEDAVRTFTYEEYRKSTLSIIGKYGDVIELRSFSSKPECLEALLQKFRSERRGAKKCSADRYIDALIVRKA